MPGLKRSTIRTLLNKKIENFLSSIKDNKDLVRELRKNIIVTGGAIPSMLIGEEVNDYDVYLKDKECIKKLIRHYVDIDMFPIHEIKEINIRKEVEDRIKIFIPSDGAHVFDTNKKDRYQLKCITDNALSFTDNFQIIIRFYGEPEDILRNFDFVHTHCYFDYAKQHLELPAKSLECILSRTLLYEGSLYPLCSVIRTRKFINRGWRITAGQYLKMLLQLNDVDLTNIEILKQQIIGVDSLYMIELIEKLSAIEADKVDSAYVIELIDSIFEE
jgi:hypothetical protein